MSMPHLGADRVVRTQCELECHMIFRDLRRDAVMVQGPEPLGTASTAFAFRGFLGAS